MPTQAEFTDKVQALARSLSSWRNAMGLTRRTAAESQVAAVMGEGILAAVRPTGAWTPGTSVAADPGINASLAGVSDGDAANIRHAFTAYLNNLL